MAEKEENMISVWMNWESRVISFSEEKEGEKLTFPTHEEKFKFVMERIDEGFGIQ